MHGFVPLDAFEHDAQAVIAVGSDASIRLCNRAARRMLGCSCPGLPREPCWTFVSFLALDGAPFCRPVCPVQLAARDGRCGAQHWIVPTQGPGAGRTVEMVSFFVPWDGSERRAVVHFLRPASRTEATGDTTSAIVLDAAQAISAREEEVLRLLSDGRSTRGIAMALGIAKNTVRHHLGNVFRKLGVHGRIEALAAVSRRVTGAESPTIVPRRSRARAGRNVPAWFVPFTTTIAQLASMVD